MVHHFSQGAGARSLGSGVTVYSPGSASPGNGSPEGVTIGLVTALSTGHFVDLCKYSESSQRSGCTSGWSGPPALAGDLAMLPFFKNVKLGYTAIDGDRALTGIGCILKQYPSCFTKNDPAAILDSGKSFSALWPHAIMSPRNAYSLSPAIKINGTCSTPTP